MANVNPRSPRIREKVWIVFRVSKVSGTNIDKIFAHEADANACRDQMNETRKPIEAPWVEYHVGAVDVIAGQDE